MDVITKDAEGIETNPEPTVPTSSPASQKPAGAGGKTIGPYAMIPLTAIDTANRERRGAAGRPFVNRLVASLQRHEIINPLHVVKAPGQDTYQLVNGLHRLEAARRVGLTEVPARILAEADTITLDVLRSAFSENKVRKDLNAVDLAQEIQALREMGMTARQMQEEFGLSRSHLNNLARLTQLPAEVLRMVGDGELHPAKARALAGLYKLGIPREQIDALILDLARQGADPDNPAFYRCEDFNERVQEEKARRLGQAILQKHKCSMVKLTRIGHQTDRLRTAIQNAAEASKDLQPLVELLLPLHTDITHILEKSKECDHVNHPANL